MSLTRVLETSFALSIVRERTLVKYPLSLPPWGEGVMCNRGGHKREKCVHEYSVMCIFHQCHSVTVSQCRRGGEGEGVYSLQLVKGLLLTVDSGKGGLQ